MMIIRSDFYKWFVIIALFSLGFIVRVYNFPERINFGLEQGITLSITAQYLSGELSLLGIPYVMRQTSGGLQLYSGPLYSYALIPVMKLLGYDPIRLSLTALVINFFTAIFLYNIAKKITTEKTALFASFLFMFNSTMIDQSLTLWILNPMPLIGLLATFLLIRYRKDYSSFKILLLGLLCGVGISLEYVFLFTALLIGIYICIKRGNRILAVLMFLAGVSIPMLPTIVFDLRHDFYNLRTLLQYFLDTLGKPGQSRISTYHFYQFFPLIFLVAGWILARIYDHWRWMAGLLVFLYILGGWYFSNFSFTQAVGMPKDMNTVKILEIAKVIASDEGNDFNVAYTPDYDYRAYPIRYILTYVYKKSPMGVEEYPNSKVLYVVADKKMDVAKSGIWEIASPKMSHIKKLYMTPDKKYFLYRMTK